VLERRLSRRPIRRVERARALAALGNASPAAGRLQRRDLAQLARASTR
jgi:hypothetical protein